jgi:molybdopterin-containing oxidoreductase family iron-sulfur binding subunit
MHRRDLLRVLQDEEELGVSTDPEQIDDASRRSFLRYLGASLALAGGGVACRGKGAQASLPYSRQPPEITPGVPLFYATSSVLNGYATGLIVETHEGRPTKVEGNPEHPASLGASGHLDQALILQLYDSDRARMLRERELPRSWEAFYAAFVGQRLEHGIKAIPPPPDLGAGLSFLLEATTSPLVIDQLARLRARLPECRLHFYDPLESWGAVEGSRVCFGRVLSPLYHFERATIVLSIDASFLAQGPFWLRHARDFMTRRRGEPLDRMNRLYQIESRFSPNGVAADHRFALPPSDILPAVQAIAAHVVAELREHAAPESVRTVLAPWQASERHPFARAIARDLIAHGGESLVIAGSSQPREVHALAHLMNELLGNAGRTVSYVEPAIHEQGEASHALSHLTQDLLAGRVERLVILGGNPAYTAPADLELKDAIGRARQSAYLGLFENETAHATKWFIPLAHTLESWGDARAYDGTISLIQPMIDRLANGRTVSEVLSAFLGEPEAGAHEIMLQSYKGSDLDAYLMRGFIPDSAQRPIRVPLDVAATTKLLAPVPPPPMIPRHQLEISFDADLRVHDGAFTNNAWLLEMPEPLTTLSWGNAALISPMTANVLDVATNDRVELTADGRTVIARALILPGLADHTVAVTLGWGRSGLESAADGVGFDAYQLRTKSAPSHMPVSIKKITGTPWSLSERRQMRLDELIITQPEEITHRHPIVLEQTLAAFRADPQQFAHHRDKKPTLRAEWPQKGVQWGMSIDLGACTGCSACVIACQAENNVPVVGKINVKKHRQMHWLRVDRYVSGTGDRWQMITQPMLCQHCEHAPCEYVCPVNATVHSFDGLNEMVYNRCVGTRFCSNNCPYKVRRFNWFNFNADKPPLEQMAMNPDVTVRDRGVMEKCTYCVQRIREADIRARVENRAIRPGEVVTACQQACPTEAIVFGNINDPAEEVSRLRDSPRAFAVLNDLGTVPRTRYLAKISNTNPELEGRSR